MDRPVVTSRVLLESDGLHEGVRFEDLVAAGPDVPGLDEHRDPVDVDDRDPLVGAGEAFGPASWRRPRAPRSGRSIVGARAASGQRLTSMLLSRSKVLPAWSPKVMSVTGLALTPTWLVSASTSSSTLGCSDVVSIPSSGMARVAEDADWQVDVHVRRSRLLVAHELERGGPGELVLQPPAARPCRSDGRAGEVGAEGEGKDGRHADLFRPADDRRRAGFLGGRRWTGLSTGIGACEGVSSSWSSTASRGCWPTRKDEA